jgi:hypothetical protein
MVRQIVGITGKAGTATFIESEARMSLMSNSQNQIVRALLLDYDDISLDTLYVSGGTKGANMSLPRNREAIANELRRILYPTSTNEDPGTSVFIPLGAISFIPVVYDVGVPDERD